MKYKSREWKEFERRQAAYDERIESAKKTLILILQGPDSSSFVACRATTFEAVGVSSTGALVVGGYNFVKVHSSDEAAARTAVRAHENDRSSIYIVMRFSTALNHHIEWLKNRKSQAAQLHGKMIRTQDEALGRITNLQKSKLPWWKKV